MWILAAWAGDLVTGFGDGTPPPPPPPAETNTPGLLRRVPSFAPVRRNPIEVLDEIEAAPREQRRPLIAEFAQTSAAEVAAQRLARDAQTAAEMVLALLEARINLTLDMRALAQEQAREAYEIALEDEDAAIVLAIMLH